MFTVKYRNYTPAAAQEEGAPTFYDENEQLHGPYDLVSQEMINGYKVIYAHKGEAPGTQFGPYVGDEAKVGADRPPRPTVWVMNAQGATVARYDL